MKREEIKAIFADATAEQLKAVMDLNGADVEKAKRALKVLLRRLTHSKQAVKMPKKFRRNLMHLLQREKLKRQRQKQTEL